MGVGRNSAVISRGAEMFSCPGCRLPSVFVPFAAPDTHHPSLFLLTVPCFRGRKPIERDPRLMALVLPLQQQSAE